MRQLQSLMGLIFILVAMTACNKAPVTEPQQHSVVEPAFVQVKGKQFQLAGKPYYFVGTNFWYGAYLGADGDKGDRARLI